MMKKMVRLMGILVAALVIGTPAAFAASQMSQEKGSTVGHWSLSDRLNVNTATVAQLQKVPGISESTAKAIVAYREANGPFMSLKELKYVHGIFPMDVSRLANYLVVNY